MAEYSGNIDEARSIISDKDSPVLACAMLPEVDLLITSDAEFGEAEHPDVRVAFPDGAWEAI
ncbi:MAG: hypothetical protein MAG715_01006 [Methanonatronarchaeales archaeon]|nr:hypothetical protein [Methanonatronarchaeales archaeon]